MLIVFSPLSNINWTEQPCICMWSNRFPLYNYKVRWFRNTVGIIMTLYFIQIILIIMSYLCGLHCSLYNSKTFYHLEHVVLYNMSRNKNCAWWWVQKHVMAAIQCYWSSQSDSNAVDWPWSWYVRFAAHWSCRPGLRSARNVRVTQIFNPPCSMGLKKI